MTSNRLLRKIGLGLIKQAEADEVNWEEVANAGLDLSLMAFEHDGTEPKGGLEICR